MDRSISLTILLIIFSFGFVKTIELHEESGKAEDVFQMESDGREEKRNFPGKSNYNITDKSQFLADYGEIKLNPTVIRSLEKIAVSEKSGDSIMNITFTDKFIKILPNPWIAIEQSLFSAIKDNDFRNLYETLNGTTILAYINGRFHKSSTALYFARSGVKFYNHKGVLKSYLLQSLVFLPEGQKRRLLIRMAMVTHYSIYNYYKALENNCLTEAQIAAKSTEKLSYDMLIIAKEMKGIFQSLEISDNELYIDLVKTVVTRTPEEMKCLEENRINSNTIDGDEAFLSCQSDLMGNDNSLDLPKVDFLVVYTRDRIYFNKEITTGVVFSETMCVIANLVIIYWEDVHSNSIISAQMLARTLGVKFDGDFNNCDSDKKFVMSDTLNKKRNNNSFTFSSCSGPYVDKYIDRLDEIRGFNCLDKRDWKKPVEQEDSPLTLPGLIHDLNEQCGIIHGQYSFYCGNKNLDKLDVVCKAIRCFYNSGCRSTQKFVLDGTPCANFKMCLRGKCVVDGRAPEVLTLPGFNRRRCNRKTSTKKISAVELVSQALVREDSVTDSLVHQEDAAQVGIEDFDYVNIEEFDFVNIEDYEDENDGVDEKFSTEENRKEVMEHH